MSMVKPRELYSDKRLEAEPDRMTSKIQLIILMDIAGYTGNQISESIGMTPGRVSVIRQSPLYQQEKTKRQEEFNLQVLGKKSDKIVAGDPVENRIKDLAMRAVGVYEEVMEKGKSEIARKSAADSVLDRAGYKAHTDRTVLSVEVTERMADRFEKVLKRTTLTKES